MFRTNNPAFKNNPFGPAQTWKDLETRHGVAGIPGERVADHPRAMAAAGAMTINGTVTKTAILLAFCGVTAMISWNTAMTNPSLSMMFFIGGIIGHFALSILTIAKPSFSSFTAPLVAIAEGLLVGGISAMYAKEFAVENGALNTGLIINAGLLTFGIAGGLLTTYALGLIRPNRIFRNVVLTLTFGLFAYWIIAMAASFFFGNFALASVYDPHNGGLVSIGFSVFVVILASANLVLDFEIVEEGVANGAPKYMEWFGGFAILITIVWMYLAILRLLAKLQSRD